MAQLADAHVLALLALVRVNVPCYDGKVGDNPAVPYTVLYADLGTLERSSVDDASAFFNMSFQITAVGSTRQQAGWAADKARVALVGAAPSVSGRTTSMIVQESSQPVIRDDDVVPPMFYAVATYRLVSVPST